MIRKVQELIKRENLFLKENTLLLAISGGADSVFLFFILKELGYNFQLAHCNFNLRGSESDKDEDFIRALKHGRLMEDKISHFKKINLTRREHKSSRVGCGSCKGGK